MDYRSIVERIDNGFLEEEVSFKVVFIKNEYIPHFNNHIIFKIVCSKSFDRENGEIPVFIQEHNIGKIIFLKGQYFQDINALPDEKKYCFLIDNKSNLIDSESYTFRYDYLILNSDFLSIYLNDYKGNSSLWGDFFHVENLPSIEFKEKKSISKITARKLKIDNQAYFNNLFHGIQEVNPFNRFLKLYHLLELQFDLHTAIKIKNLLDDVDGGKEQEISNKLRDYTRDEWKRLDSLITQQCTDLPQLITHLNKVKAFKKTATEIFYTYGRSESNPLKRNHFESIITKPEPFEKSVIDALGGYAFNLIIPKVTRYWIYRVRSSIAHNKFGEYIMDHKDEKFIVELAEPLLKEVLNQCFKP